MSQHDFLQHPNIPRDFWRKIASNIRSSCIVFTTLEKASNMLISARISIFPNFVESANNITTPREKAAYFPVFLQPTPNKNHQINSILAAMYPRIRARVPRPATVVSDKNTLNTAVPKYDITSAPPINLPAPAVIITTPTTTDTKVGRNIALSPVCLQHEESFIIKSKRNKCRHCTRLRRESTK